jgi:peptide/nickel transport system substrate-binding protein
MFQSQKSKLLLYCVILAAILIMVGCTEKSSSSVKSDSPESGTNSSENSSENQTISKLNIAIPKDSGTLNIYTSSSSSDYLVGLVFDKLFAPSPYVDEPQPWLAKSAEQLDTLTWEVKLREGIKWHDGTPFTAEDVKFTFEQFRDGSPNRHTHHMSQVPRVDEIEAVDPLTVRLKCGYPCPTLDSITLADLPILPKHIWESVENPRKYTEMPVGTGPYKLVEYQADQFYKFEANTEYFKGRPLVDTLIMPVIKDPSSTFNALRSGEVDVAARGVPPELLDTFKNLPDMKVIQTSPLSLVEIRINYEKEPFNQPKFRQALSLAVHREHITETILLGQGRPGIKGYPHPDSPWTNPDLSTPLNKSKAEQLLNDLQFTDQNGDGIRENTDGKPLQFTIKVASTEPTWIRSAEMVQKQLAEVGIDATVQTLDPGAIGKLFRSREFDMYINSISPHGVADPDQFVMSHRSGYLWKKGLAYPEMESLIEEWMQADNVPDRKEVLFDMQELFNSQPTSIVLYYPDENYAFNQKAYSEWTESLGYGIVHKYSFLSPQVRKEVLE